MEKTRKLIGILKWLCFIMRTEQNSLMGREIVSVIRDSISGVAQMEYMVEIKKIRSGAIARVYLINAEEYMAKVKNGISAGLERSGLSGKVYALQLTNMRSRSELPAFQKLLNEQLIRQLWGSDGKKDGPKDKE